MQNAPAYAILYDNFGVSASVGCAYNIYIRPCYREGNKIDALNIRTDTQFCIWPLEKKCKFDIFSIPALQYGCNVHYSDIKDPIKLKISKCL